MTGGGSSGRRMSQAFDASGWCAARLGILACELLVNEREPSKVNYVSCKMVPDISHATKDTDLRPLHFSLPSYLPHRSRRLLGFGVVLHALQLILL